MSQWVAYYAPKLKEGESDPTKSFPSEEEAHDYVFSQMCNSCKHMRQLFLESGDTEEGSEFPPCTGEWFVVPQEVYDNANSFIDIFRWPNNEVE